MGARRRSLLASAIVVCWTAGIGVAAADEVVLSNGDHLTGRITREDDAQVTLEHPTLGTMVLSMASVQQLVYADPATQAAARAAAQQAKEAKRQQALTEAAHAQAWKREAELGYTLARGNSKTQLITGKFKADRTVGHHEFNTQADYLSSETDRTLDAQRYGGMARYGRKFGHRLAWSHFYKVDATHDRFDNIDWRASPTTGLGYTFFDSAKGKASLEGGGGFEHTKFRDSTPSRDEMVLTTRAYAEAGVFAQSKASEEFSTVHPLGARAGEFRLKSETALTNPLSDWLSLRFSVVDEFNSDPTGDVKRNDFRLTSSLVATF